MQFVLIFGFVAEFAAFLCLWTWMRVLQHWTTALITDRKLLDDRQAILTEWSGSLRSLHTSLDRYRVHVMPGMTFYEVYGAPRPSEEVED